MTSGSFANLSAQQLRRATAIKEKIEALELELAKILGVQGSNHSAGSEGKVARKRWMSPEGRARIARAQRVRWAKFKAARKSQTKV